MGTTRRRAPTIQAAPDTSELMKCPRVYGDSMSATPLTISAGMSPCPAIANPRQDEKQPGCRPADGTPLTYCARDDRTDDGEKQTGQPESENIPPHGVWGTDCAQFTDRVHRLRVAGPQCAEYEGSQAEPDTRADSDPPGRSDIDHRRPRECDGRAFRAVSISARGRCKSSTSRVLQDDSANRLGLLPPQRLATSGGSIVCHSNEGETVSSRQPTPAPIWERQLPALRCRPRVR